MAAHVQSNSGVVQNGTSISVAFGSNNTAGNTIVVMAGCYAYHTVAPTISDTLGNTYNQIVTEASVSHKSLCWVVKNCNAGANTITLTNSAGTIDYDVVIAEYSGPSTTRPVDTSVGSPTTSASLLANVSSEILIAFSYNQTAVQTQTISPSTGWTLRFHTSNPDAASACYWDNVGAAAGSYSATTNNSGAATSLLMIALAPDGGGGAVTVFEYDSVLPQGTNGAAYSQTLTPGGGTSPYTFALGSGALPTGLSLSSGGTISGTPTATGTFTFTVQVTDTNGYTGSQAFSIAVAAPATGGGGNYGFVA